MLYSHINATHPHALVHRSTYALRFSSTFMASGNDWGFWEMSHLGGSAQRGACESGAWLWGQNSPRDWSGASGSQSEWSGGYWVAPSVDHQWGARDWHAPSIGLDGGQGERNVAPSIGLDGGKGEWSSGGDHKNKNSKYDDVKYLGGSKNMVALDDRKDMVFGALAIIVSRLPGAMPMFTRLSLGSWDVPATMSMLYILGRVDEKTPIRAMQSFPGITMFSIADASMTLALSFESIFADVNERAVLLGKLFKNIRDPAQIMQYAVDLGQLRKQFYGKRDYRHLMPHEDDRYLRRRTTEEELGRLRKQTETSGGGQACAQVEQPSTGLGGAICEANPRKAHSVNKTTSRVNTILIEFRALLASGFASGLSQSDMAYFQRRLRSQETRLKVLLPGIDVLPRGFAQ